MSDAATGDFEAFVEDVHEAVVEHCAAPGKGTDEFKLKHLSGDIEGEPQRVAGALRRLRGRGEVEIVRRRSNGATWRLVNGDEDGDRDE